MKQNCYNNIKHLSLCFGDFFFKEEASTDLASQSGATLDAFVNNKFIKLYFAWKHLRCV